jgi:hypothetical protein
VQTVASLSKGAAVVSELVARHYAVADCLTVLAPLRIEVAPVLALLVTKASKVAPAVAIAKHMAAAFPMSALMIVPVMPGAASIENVNAGTWIIEVVIPTRAIPRAVIRAAIIACGSVAE